jgi:hypothetical protein
MAGNINDFKSSFKGDLARTSKFDVNIPIPLTLLPYVSSAKSLNYRCEATQLPGRTFGTLEQRTYGPVEKFPFMNTYNDIEMTFLLDDDMNQKVFLDAWFNYINPLYNYNYRYKSDYSTLMTVNQYDVTGALSYSVNLFDAYPVSMNQLDLDWAGEGVHKLSVTFAYTYWQNNSLQAIGMELVDAGINSVASLIPGGLGGSGLGQISSRFNSIPNGVAGQVSNFLR